LTVPSYDYVCHDCKRRVTLYYKTIADYEAAAVTCPRCGGTNLSRRIKRVRVLKGDEARLMGLDDDATLDDLEDADPATMGRFMRRMADEMGEDMGDEFNEVVGRLEKGEDPEQIAESMPDLAGDDGGDLDAGL
jgi:putative FmdB family regulatory protein